MKILLVGEYSGVHTELSRGLKQIGYDVTTMSDGDGYKKYPADIVVLPPFYSYKTKIHSLYSALMDYLGIKGIISFLRIWNKLKKQVIGYDVVQLINPISLSGFGSIVNLFFLVYVKKHNKKVTLLAVGDDYYWLKDNMKKRSKFVEFNHLKLSDFIRKSTSLKYVYGLGYKYLNDYAINISSNIIPGLYDYYRVYNWSEKITELVPFSVNEELISEPFKIKESDKIIIFNGWQVGKEERKGNDIFDKAVKRLQINYPDKTEYRIVKSVPYNEYLKLYSDSHIYFDQCYSYDKGVSGLLGMAAGKVVFSGFEANTLRLYPFYDEKKEIGLNSSTDEESIYNTLVELISDYKRLEIISKNAIEFVKKNHQNSFIVDKFIRIWNS